MSSSVVYQYKVLIRETHLDVFGHMNNATYLELFEEARWDTIVKNGFDLNYIKRTQTGPVILECNVKFLLEILPREEITITVEQISYHGVIGKLKQQMLKANGEVACEAVFTYGLFDLKNRRLISPTEEWLKAIR